MGHYSFTFHSQAPAELSENSFHSKSYLYILQYRCIENTTTSQINDGWKGQARTEKSAVSCGCV